MAKRKIIQISEKKCNGCGLCIPNCPEGALQIIDGKARLISDLFCDGLGACIGHCPQGAIKVVEREAEPYSEAKVMENIIRQGPNTIKAHLLHLKGHGETGYLQEAVQTLRKKNIALPDLTEEEGCMGHQCPGSAYRDLSPAQAKTSQKPQKAQAKGAEGIKSAKGMKGKLPAVEEQESQLRQWPVQLSLLPVQAPVFNNAHLLISADCVAYANPNFHAKLLYGKALAIGCPKLDDIGRYTEKLTQIFRQNSIKSITVAIMEVPCCAGLHFAVQQAIKDSGKDIPLIKEIVSIDGTLR